MAMFFLLSKTLGFFALPSNFVISVAIVGVVLLFTRFARIGRWVLVASFATLLLTGFSPLGNLLIYALESRFEPWDPARGPPDGIVILGGAIDPELSSFHGETALNDNAERLTSVAEIARRYPAARIVYSGGSGTLFATSPIEADYVPHLLESFGIARDRIVLENRSRNTAENAAFSKQLIQPKPGERWLLVTSGYHMPRAIGCFRKIGFPVEAYPVDWRVEDIGRIVFSINAFSAGLAATDLAMHEWAGLLVYWLTGRSSELLPGPDTRLINHAAADPFATLP
jgi:uncharacterized SAM-binding protein YcdF (DUF218 family)